jgi:hypothetical protein
MTATAADIYAAYPRHVARRYAIECIKKALLEEEADWLLERTRLFAGSPAGQKGEFTPHPSTWFNQERYHDDEREWFRDGDKPLPPSLDKCRTPTGIGMALRDKLATHVNGKRATVMSSMQNEITLLLDGERVTLDAEACKTVKLTKERANA